MPLDATETVDTDGDGIGNNADTDDDGDGVADSGDSCLLTSTDRDVLPNGCAFVNEAQQLALDVGAGLHKGYSTSFSSDGLWLAVGDPFYDGNGNNAGQVRVYAWDGNAWVQQGDEIVGESGEIGLAYPSHSRVTVRRWRLGSPTTTPGLATLCILHQIWDRSVSTLGMEMPGCSKALILVVKRNTII